MSNEPQATDPLMALREALAGDSILGVAGTIRVFAQMAEENRGHAIAGWVFAWREWADRIDKALTEYSAALASEGEGLDVELHPVFRHTHNGTTHDHHMGCGVHYGKPSWKCPECQSTDPARLREARPKEEAPHVE
jgi:hypothetical protein